MPQLHCYLRENLAQRLQAKAKQKRSSVSSYLASLVEKDVGAQWPENYFMLFGGWADDENVVSNQHTEPEQDFSEVPAKSKVDAVCTC
jgi:hypothetical protein